MKLLRRIFVLMSVQVPSLCFAQVTGSRLEPSTPRVDPDRVFATMIDCYAKRYTSEAVRYLKLLPGSNAEAKSYSGMTNALEVCLNSRDMVLEGNFFESVAKRYRRSLAKTLVMSNAALVPGTLPPSTDAKPWFATAIAGTKDYSAAALALDEFADCVVRRDWPTARALALAKTKSGDEKRAVAALAPPLGPCVPSGQTVNVERAAIPAVVSEAVYHIAVGPALEARYSSRGAGQ